MSMPSRAELKENLKLLKERLSERPMDLDARMRIARTYRLLDNKKDAVAHYAAVARYLSLAGHPLQALAVLKELLQVDPRHEESLLFLAKLYARTRAADPSNRGRVAVPILDDDAPLPGSNPLTDGVAMTTTGIWRAIRPTPMAELAVVRSADDVGAIVDKADKVSASRTSGEAAPARARHHDDAVAPPPAVPEDDGDGGKVDRALEASDEAEPSLELLDADDVLTLDEGLGFEEAVLARVPLFSSLDAGAFVTLSHSMVLVRHAPGEALFREGDAGDSCFVLVKGTAYVTRMSGGGDVTRDVLGPGDVVGLFALVRAEQRQATVTAAGDVESFEIDRSALATVFARHESARAAFVEMLSERILDALFLELPGLAAQDEAARAALRAQVTTTKLAAGDDAFGALDKTDGLWVVLDGELGVGDERPAGDVSGAPLRVGDWVLCTSASLGEPAGVTARAIAPCTVAVLDAKAVAAAGLAGAIADAAQRAPAVRTGTIRR